MRYKKILLTFLSAAFFGVACADDFIITQKFYPATGTSTETRQITLYNSSLSEAFKAELSYCNIGFNTNTFLVNINFAGSAKPPPYAVSNVTAGVLYTRTQNFEYNRAQTFCQCFLALCQKYHLDIFGLGLLNPTYCYVSSGVIYPREFNFYTFEQNVYQALSAVYLLELTDSISTFRQIQTDVSSLVPALESHAVTVSNLASHVDATSTQITNRQAQSNASLQDIRNVVNSIGSSVAGIPTLISNQSLDTMGIDDLGALWLDLKGVDWQHSATPLQDLVAQNLVSSGLASSVSDAQQKLSDPAWRNSTFVPRVKYSQKKANAIAQLEASGISPPAGKSWRDLEVPELETIFEYQYNTPLADVTEVTTNWLPNIGGKVDDIAGSVGDIRDKVENGIFEVNVMNWPDDFLGFQVTLSNAFAEAFANLSITGRVIELDEDYKRYRDLYGLNGINAPSFDTVFSNAQFLAVGSPNEVNWWRESQNLLSYIAYYGTYNERIYNEISSTNFLAELAAITNRLSVLGDVEATVRRLTDDAIESGEDIKSTLENLTYYRGVSKWCDDYLQAGDTPDRVHLFDLDDHEFYIDIGQSYGFVDLIHGISAFAITLSWICTLPYMIIWLIEWFRKFADFWATKVVGP